MLEYHIIFANGHVPNCSVILTVKKLLEHFTKKLQKTNQRQLRAEKVIKRNGYKLYVKWK